MAKQEYKTAEGDKVTVEYPDGMLPPPYLHIGVPKGEKSNWHYGTADSRMAKKVEH